MCPLSQPALLEKCASERNYLTVVGSLVFVFRVLGNNAADWAQWCMTDAVTEESQAGLGVLDYSGPRVRP